MEPWWELHVGYVTEDDIRVSPRGSVGVRGFSPVLTMTMMSQLCSDEEHKGVDMVIDRGTLQAGLLKRAVVFSES